MQHPRATVQSGDQCPHLDRLLLDQTSWTPARSCGAFHLTGVPSGQVRPPRSYLEHTLEEIGPSHGGGFQATMTPSWTRRVATLFVLLQTRPRVVSLCCLSKLGWLRNAETGVSYTLKLSNHRVPVLRDDPGRDACARKEKSGRLQERGKGITTLFGQRVCFSKFLVENFPLIYACVFWFDRKYTLVTPVTWFSVRFL